MHGRRLFGAGGNSGANSFKALDAVYVYVHVNVHVDVSVDGFYLITNEGNLLQAQQHLALHLGIHFSKIMSDAGRSSNGKTDGSGPSDRGSNPCLPANSVSPPFTSKTLLESLSLRVFGD